MVWDHSSEESTGAFHEYVHTAKVELNTKQTGGYFHSLGAGNIGEFGMVGIAWAIATRLRSTGSRHEQLPVAGGAANTKWISRRGRVFANCPPR